MHRASEFRVEPAGIQPLEQGALGVRAGDNARNGNLLPACQHNAYDAALAHANLRDLGPMSQLYSRALLQHATQIGRRRTKNACGISDMMMEQPKRGAAGARSLA
ncbi:hypothetical protein D3C83_38030 [compost metagenome]